MKTPIIDMLREYADKNLLRLHMPGHKGSLSKYDITEIEGADNLYAPDGIIKESERIAGELFGADTFFSTEGSSLSIRAMLYLASLYAKKEGKKPLVLAARNVHRAFISAAALLDFDVEWIISENSTYLSSCICPIDIEKRLSLKDKPTAIYLTSPDYLGSITSIREISRICKRHGILLLVDNAHGAYLKFLNNSLHPIDLGADMCCDSAHKTLPSLTGGGYLHINKSAPKLLSHRAKEAMTLFASSSPSYLILASLDYANSYISNGYMQKMQSFVSKIDALKQKIKKIGFDVVGDEPLKLTLKTKGYGYLGYGAAKILYDMGIVCEFSDPDFLVMMLSCDMSDENLEKIYHSLKNLKKLSPIEENPPKLILPKKKLSPREAMFIDEETLPTNECLGRVLSSVTVSCPPAIPIAVSGEVIDEAAINTALYYGIKELKVIKED